jgi:flagellar protein FliJ
MSTTFPLQSLLDLAQGRMDEAARELGALLARENEDHQKLETLKAYRDEYLNRFNAAARSGLAPDAWRNYSAFICRIDEAIEQQCSQLQKAKGQTALGQQAWLAQRNKVKAFDTLSERHHEKQRYGQIKKEQHFSDELSARRFTHFG